MFQPRSLRARLAFAAALLVATALGAAAFLRERPAEAYAGMPADLRAFWSWVTTLNAADSDAGSDHRAAVLGRGADLLRAHPHLTPLYVRFADACAGPEVPADTRAACADALRDARPPTPAAALYRAAALATLDTTEAASAAWREVAASAALDVPLARRVADAAGPAGWLPAADSAFARRLAADTAHAGAAFGRGLVAVRAGDWAAAEAFLARAERHAPDESDVYREQGRVLHATGRADRLDATLRRGLDAALARHDLEAAMILRGNLGLALLQQDAGLEEAEALFREALGQSRLLADPAREALNLYRIAGVRLRQHRYDEGLALADSALALDRAHTPAQVAQALALRGTAQWALYRFSDAEATLAEALAAARAKGDPQVELQAAASLVQLRYRTGRYDDARALGLAALERAQATGLRDAESVARMVLADVERFAGNFEQARAQYAAGAAVSEALGNTARLAEFYARLGQTMLEMQDPAAAKAYFDRLVHLDTDDERTLEGLGRVYFQFGNYEQALAYYDRSLGALEAGNTAQRVTLLTNKAYALLHLSQYDRAERTIAEAERVVQPGMAQERYDLAGARALVHMEQGQYAEAIVAFKRASALGERGRNRVVMWQLQLGEALAYWRSGQPKLAEPQFRAAISTVEALRDNLYTTGQRAAFVQDKTLAYKQFVAFLRAHGRDEEAFRYVERARSRSLADLLFTTQQARASDMSTPEGRVLEAQRRRHALAASVGELDGASGTDAVRGGQLRREFLRADSAYGRSLSSMPAGLYTALARPLDAAEARRLLRPGEALVVYSLGSPRSAASPAVASVAYVFTPHGVTVRTLRGDPAELADRVRFLREGISRSGKEPGTGWEPAARRLHADLVAPVLAGLPAGVTHLHVIPEGVLHYVPFAALQDARGRFLIERYTVSVAPSASVLALARQRGEETKGRWRRIVALADPTGRLPGTRYEVEALQAMRAVRVDALVGAQATQENLELLAPDADVLHLATHGTFVSRAPGLSHLELAGGERLDVSEIERLRLDRPYLVTLSACETALGGGANSDVPPGDEWVGLNQAFLAAGAPSVLASLWAIDDRATGRFMSGFYTHLLDPRGKAWALAQMQRSFLRDARLRHPFYWAAFTLTGDPVRRPPHVDPPRR